MRKGRTPLAIALILSILLASTETTLFTEAFQPCRLSDCSYPRKSFSRTAIVFSRRSDSDDTLISLGENLVRVASTPVLGSIELVYVVVLGITAFLVPPAQALLTIAVFGLLSVLGRSLIVDEEQEETPETEDDFPSTASLLNLFSVVFAILTSSLLSSESTSGLSIPSSVLVIGLPVAVILLGVRDDRLDQPTSREKELDRWDTEFRQGQHNDSDSSD